LSSPISSSLLSLRPVFLLEESRPTATLPSALFRWAPFGARCMLGSDSEEALQSSKRTCRRIRSRAPSETIRAVASPGGLGSRLSFELKTGSGSLLSLARVDGAGVDVLSGANESSLPPLGVSQGLIDLSRLPEPQEQHSELSGDGHHCPLLAVLAPLRRQSQAPAPKI
jgi:hypothetical protein